MRKVLTLFIAACLVASSLPGCILTPLHPERREVTNWDLELLSVEGVEDVPVTIFGVVALPVAWVVDSVIVNGIDSYKGSVLDTHGYNWEDEDENVSQSYAKSYQRSLGSVLLLPLDWAWRGNLPVAPHDPELWNGYWNEHVEVTEVSDNN